jgi:hypothetical protein
VGVVNSLAQGRQLSYRDCRNSISVARKKLSTHGGLSENFLSLARSLTRKAKEDVKLNDNVPPLVMAAMMVMMIEAKQFFLYNLITTLHLFALGTSSWTLAMAQLSRGKGSKFAGSFIALCAPSSILSHSFFIHGT